VIDLTIVIASFETKALLEACLASLARAQAAAPALAVEVIVVDNGSRDGSPEAVRDRWPEVRLIALARNRGFAAAVNRGLRARRGRHVGLINSDLEIAPDGLARAVAILDAKPHVGVVGADLRAPDGGPQRCVHPFPGWQTELLPEPVLRRLRPRGAPRPVGQSAAPDLVREVEAVRGAAFFVRGDLLEKIGLLDETYFFFLEETDFCWRVAQAGDRVVHAEGLGASHHLGASSKRRAPLATRIEFHRSLYRFLARRRGPGLALTARCLRAGRAGLGCLVAAPIALFVPDQRARLAQRWGLLLWHLRGCPDAPRLDRALDLVLAGGRDRGTDLGSVAQA